MKLAVIEGGKQGVRTLQAEYRRKEPAQEMPERWLGKDESPFGYSEFIQTTFGLESVLHDRVLTLVDTLTVYKGSFPCELEYSAFTPEEFDGSSRIEHLMQEGRVKQDYGFEKQPGGLWVRASYDKTRPRRITVEGERLPEELYQELLTALESYRPFKSLRVVE